MVAEGAIGEGERLALIPHAAVISCANSARVLGLVREDARLRGQLARCSSWVPLLLALLGECALKVASTHSLTHSLIQGEMWYILPLHFGP